MDGVASMTAELVQSLAASIARFDRRMQMLDDYYRGQQPLAFLHPEVSAAVGERLQSVVVNWPRVIVDSIEERLDVEGFRLATDQPASDDLWQIWQANDLDEHSQLCHLDSLIYGRAFVLVWGDDDTGQPRITVESARQMAVIHVPGSNRLAAAVKLWADDDNRHATLFLPDRAERYVSRGQAYGLQPYGAVWELVDVLGNPLGEVPVEPFVNRPRLTTLDGESELSDVIPLADAVNKLATDLMVTSEYHAMPRRYATGIEVPHGGVDKAQLREDVRKYWSDATAGRVWLGPKGVEFGQFPEASLENFVNAISMFTAQIAAVSGLPPHYLGVRTENPASADAIRSAEASLVKRARRKMRSLGGSWERVMRRVVRLRDGDIPAEAQGMETIWRDPETPTVAQKADAAVKLVQADVITPVQALEDIGYTPLQIAREQERREQAATTAATAAVDAQVRQAQRLMDEQGLSQAAAFAAVGLLQAANDIRNT